MLSPCVTGCVEGVIGFYDPSGSFAPFHDRRGLLIATTRPIWRCAEEHLIPGLGRPKNRAVIEPAVASAGRHTVPVSLNSPRWCSHRKPDHICGYAVISFGSFMGIGEGLPSLVSLPSLEARPEILALSGARSPAGLGRRISRPHSPRGRGPASGLIAGFFEPWDSA
jgi:hypothetical protein